MSTPAERGTVPARGLPPILLAFSLAGCAIQPTVPGTSIAWSERQSELQALDVWQARGRIAVKSGDDGAQGSLRWDQDGSEARIRVSGPFGAGAYEIDWNPDRVVVTSRDGEVAAAYTGADAADQFLSEQLGWTFPAINTRYWILGVPDPDFASREQFDTDGWLVGIEQNGWSVAYDGFQLRDEVWLPRKITMENDRARLRLVVDRWKTGTVPP